MNNIDESVDTLLNALIPNDPLIQEDARPDIMVGDLGSVDVHELKNCAWALSPNRAPGMDSITAKMVRVLWPAIAPRLMKIINESLRTAQFPSSWKAAQVIPILKGQDRDTALPKSYRPVSLLPVMGKITEKVINNRLKTQISPNLSVKQFGFTEGRSTMDAIQKLLTWSSLRTDKYVITIFLDISGAFDNLTWPALQRDLSSLGASQHMRYLIADYLRGRTATMTIGGVSKTVRVTKGCPQGSILGPVLWNVTVEALLRTDFQDYVHAQAYADDIAISVAGPDRRTLIDRAEATLLPVLDWARDRGLTFSAQK